MLIGGERHGTDSVRRKTGETVLEVPCGGIAGLCPVQCDGSAGHADTGQLDRFGTDGVFLHEHVVDVDVVVTAAQRRFPVEGNHHGVVRELAQLKCDDLSGGGNRVIDEVAIAVVAPDGGVGGTPRGSQVRGHQHHEPDVGLVAGRDAVGGRCAGHRQVEGEAGRFQGGQVNGRRDNPSVDGRTPNVEAGMVVPKDIPGVEIPSAVLDGGK